MTKSKEPKLSILDSYPIKFYHSIDHYIECQGIPKDVKKIAVFMYKTKNKQYPDFIIGYTIGKPSIGYESIISDLRGFRVPWIRINPNYAFEAMEELVKLMTNDTVVVSFGLLGMEDPKLIVNATTAIPDVVIKHFG